MVCAAIPQAGLANVAATGLATQDVNSAMMQQMGFQRGNTEMTKDQWFDKGADGHLVTETLAGQVKVHEHKNALLGEFQPPPKPKGTVWDRNMNKKTLSKVPSILSRGWWGASLLKPIFGRVTL